MLTYYGPAERRHYVILWADWLDGSGYGDPIHLGPDADRWTRTEGDEQYDYGYLADECGDDEYRAVVDGGEGRHVKYVAELSAAEFYRWCEANFVELDDSGMPEDYNETMGSLTKYGWLAAIAVDLTEGWSPTRVIDSSAYISTADIPAGWFDITTESEAA